MQPSKITAQPSSLFYFSFFLSACTLLLILAGGLVTSHDAGLAVPDWPLSYGRLMPPMVGNVFWEHGHRMIAGTVGILTLLFAIGIQKAEPRPWMKKLGWIAFAAVVLQAVLGGLTVKFLLPAPISIFHACLAQTFFCLVISMTYFLSPRLKGPFPAGTRQRDHFRPGQVSSETCPVTEMVPLSRNGNGPDNPRLFILTTGFIYLQLILGATVRHTHHGIVLHIMNAFLVVLHVALSFGKAARFYATDKLMTRTAGALGFFTLVQVFLGMGAFIFTHVLEQGYAPGAGQVFFTAAHQTTGAVVLAASVLMSLIASIR